MNIKNIAAAAALALGSLAAHASDADLGVLGAGESASFSSASATGGFYDIYSFELSSAGSLVGSFADLMGVTLTEVKLAGEGAYRYLTLGSDLSFSYSDLSSGYYALYVFGTPTDGTNSYTGTMTAQPVPEPETYAMLLAGLGVMGAVAARRRKSV